MTVADLERARLVQSIERVAHGDRAALRDVYDRTSAKLFGVCLRILADRGEAEDVLQEVYLTIWRRADAYDPARASPITWLATLARNRAIDRVRARPRTAAASIDAAATVADAAPSPAELVEAAGERRRLDDCMAELDARHAQAIRTAFFDGVTYDELARRESVPAGTMKSWIRRALLRLRDCLER